MDFGGIEVEVSVGQLTPAIHWEQRHDLFKQVKRSRGIYMSLSPEERDIIIGKVHGALAVMLDRVDEWIPDAFVGDQPGESLDIKLTLVMADVDSSVAKVRESSTTRFNEVTEQLKESLADLENEDDD